MDRIAALLSANTTVEPHAGLIEDMERDDDARGPEPEPENVVRIPRPRPCPRPVNIPRPRPASLIGGMSWR